MEGAGSVGIWGFSPAMDLMESVEPVVDDQDAHFLLMGAKDARHIIKTIAHVGRHSEFTGCLNFYVHEDQAPLLARTILLLSVFLDQESEVNNEEQTHLFLEFFGNIYLRSKSYDQMKEIATKLLILLGDSAGTLAPLFNFSHLRFKDRDDLEVVFKFWRDDSKKAYEIDKLWDTRLRKLLGSRYDVRENIFDWDYHMKLVKEITIIHKSEYLRWRLHGLAYEARDASYDKPNRTTATIEVMKQDGLSVTKWGYFNDVLTGPFVPYGIETEKKELIEKSNDQHKHASSELAEYNIQSYIEEYKNLKEDLIKAFDEKIVELAKGVGLHLLGKPGEKGKSVLDDAGGGGERVLWVLIAGLLKASDYSQYKITIYCKEGAEKEKVLAKVQDQFNVAFTESEQKRIHLVGLKHWGLLEAKRYPRLTLIAQSLGSALVALEALMLETPEVFVDTIGFAFTFPIAKLFGCKKVIAYVHYPTISSDMIGVVRGGVESFNNKGMAANSSLGRNLKLGYYKAFAFLYSIVGPFADVILANSSWTIGHLNNIWNLPDRTSVLYPPCDTNSLASFGLEGRQNVIVSVAQFRPEKAHTLQLQSLLLLLNQHPEYRTGPRKVTLLFIGGVRNPTDQALATSVRTQSVEMGIEDNVEILINASYPDLKAWLGRASIGLHAMRDEHFGIGVVEYMAAGLITVAHNSGGPKMDIVSVKQDSQTGLLDISSTTSSNSTSGFLAQTKEEYASEIYKALTLTLAEQMDIRKRARESVLTRFSNKSFQEGFLNAMKGVLTVNSSKAPKKNQ
ncbi:asparagine-linked glycosylation protein [Rhizoclosmatium sp. JEL0117]|nr:asparagine-linked glycosylation protein [Rhizoclosmatium sp. JEL0117]